LKLKHGDNSKPAAFSRLAEIGGRRQLSDFYTHSITSKTMQPNTQPLTHTPAAKSASHNDRTLLQEVPAWAWIVLAWLGWLAFHPVTALTAAGVGLVVWRVAEKHRTDREYAARVGACANITGAQVVTSTTPYENPSEVSKRAKQMREDLRAAGNRYADQIPVIEYPFQPMIFGVGELTFAWDIYRRMCGEVLHQENMKWADKCPPEIRGALLTQIIGQPEQETI
jgi:hypothetical protein